jgi:hypothetical protein
MNEILDRLDRGRFDVHAIVDRANEFEELPAREQDEEIFFEYAGLDEVQHPLDALLREFHNARYIVRDLDGALYLVWEDLDAKVYGGATWFHEPLTRGDLISDGEIEDMEAELEDAGLDLALVRPVLSGLPADT